MMVETGSVHRLRFSFAVQGPLRYVAVLDMGRLWERLLRRCALPLAYSQGYSPHARLQFADALPVGYASLCELVDAYFGEEVDADLALRRARAQSPLGLDVNAAAYVPLNAPKPQSLMRAAVYRVEVCGDLSLADLDAAIDRVLALDSVPRSRTRKGRQQDYDLRPLIHGVTCQQSEGGCHIMEMRLRCGSQGAGRPEEMVAALEIPVQRISICRTALIWGDEEASG
jgi:radical SAM-linked protein